MPLKLDYTGTVGESQKDVELKRSKKESEEDEEADEDSDNFNESGSDAGSGEEEVKRHSGSISFEGPDEWGNAQANTRS